MLEPAKAPVFLPGVKRPEGDLDYSSPTSGEAKKSEWYYTSTPLYVFIAWTEIYSHISRLANETHKMPLIGYPATCQALIIRVLH